MRNIYAKLFFFVQSPKDGRIGENYTSISKELRVDMRVSTLPCIGGEKAVIRLLPRDNPFSGLEDLGFSHQLQETYKNWLQQPQGMIIITGPTGSGKSSTLYNSLMVIATEDVNVVTVEDPVEYVLPRITQTQVHEAAGMTFAAGLRAILRQDKELSTMTMLEDGIKAFKTEKHTEALQLLKPLAEQGNAEAQCIIANMYHLGLGVERDGTEAIQWYEKSANQGYPVAANNLAGIYLMGDCGVAASREEATKWYQLSRELGFLKAEELEKPKKPIGDNPYSG